MKVYILLSFGDNWEIHGVYATEQAAVKAGEELVPGFAVMDDRTELGLDVFPYDVKN